MKSLRKILAVLVATAMVAGMGAMAFAGSITIKSNDNVSVTGRTFKAYRILDASYSGSGSGSTIAYYVPDSMKDFYNDYFKSGTSTAEDLATAEGVTLHKYVTDQIADLKQDAEGLQSLIQAIETYFGQAGSGSAAEAATYAGQGVGSGSPATAVIDGLDTGYYLVIDQSTATSGAEKKSALILDTVADQNPEITIKVNYSTPDKSIVGASGSGSGSVKDASGTFQDLEEVNNATVGSTVNFVVNQNVPNYYGYDHFYFILNDKMTEGLTFLPETVKVYVDVDGDGKFEDELNPPYVYNRKEGYTLSGTSEVETPISHDTEKLVQGTDYYLYTDTIDYAHNGNSGTVDDSTTKTFEIAFKDIMRYPIGNAVRIEYAARVNSSALIGSGSNKNEVYLTFSNNPKNSHDGDSGSPKPGVPQSTQDHPTGDGPKDWTDTYTTGVKLIKVDNTGAILNDVQFTLSGESSEVVVNGQDVFIEDPNGQYYLLTNGKYTTKAPTTYSYMDPAPSGAVSGYVVAEAPTSGTDTSKWVNISGTAYRPYVVGESGPVYILHLNNDADYESTVVTYSPASGTPTYQGKLPVRVSMVEETKGSGTLEFAQLGEGKYTISETKVPEGFNRAQDITFEIKYIGATSGASETSAFGDWQVINAKQGNNDYDIKYNSGTGLFEVTVQNNKGVELPSTGGIGTTIFYAGGAILVLLAGVLLVSKRRFA